jgi:hypothetical protein
MLLPVVPMHHKLDPDFPMQQQQQQQHGCCLQFGNRPGTGPRQQHRNGFLPVCSDGCSCGAALDEGRHARRKCAQ